LQPKKYNNNNNNFLVQVGILNVTNSNDQVEKDQASHIARMRTRRKQISYWLKSPRER
jgi:hypothetical protein